MGIYRGQAERLSAGVGTASEDGTIIEWEKAKSFEDDMDDVDFVTFLELEDWSSSQSKIKSSYDMQYESNTRKQY